MNNLKTIRDEDLGLAYPKPAAYKERRASRAVIFDNDGNIALLFAAKNNYHKLPGGGIKKNETIADALTRELFEETGCAVKNIKELGTIEEFRNQYAVHQISYCFLADLSGNKGVPHFEDDEIADGFRLVWTDLPNAIKTLEGEAGTDAYEGKFITMRDAAILKEAARVILK